MACRICGGKAGYRRRICDYCRVAQRACKTCGEEQPADKFHGCLDCNKCRYEKNREQNIAAAKRSHFRLQARVFKAYGSKCACCGEARRTMLTLDHVNNDGYEHRKNLSMGYKTHRWRDANIGGTAVYRDVEKRGFPSEYQLLCANCNASKSRNGGVCEHVTERATTIPKGSTPK